MTAQSPKEEKDACVGGGELKFSNNYLHGLFRCFITENFSANRIHNPSYWSSTIQFSCAVKGNSKAIVYP